MYKYTCFMYRIKKLNSVFNNVLLFCSISLKNNNRYAILKWLAALIYLKLNNYILPNDVSTSQKKCFLYF